MNIQKPLKRFVYYQQVFVYRFPLREIDASFQPRVSLSVGEPSIEEARSIYQDPRMDLQSYPWQILEDKLERNIWRLLVARSEGTYIGYIFFSTFEMSVVGSKKVDFILPEYAAYPFKLYVIPSHRGYCIGKHLEQLVNTRLISENFSVAFRATNSTNSVQLHNYGRIGGDYIGSLSFVKTRIFNAVIVSKGVEKAGLKIKKTH